MKNLLSLKYKTQARNTPKIRSVIPDALKKPGDANSLHQPAEILFITSFPPVECGIATFTQDLVTALNAAFGRSFKLSVCALDPDELPCPSPVAHSLNTTRAEAFGELAEKINSDDQLSIVMIQHEFGLFKNNERAFLTFLDSLEKPFIITFHTVLPNPNEKLKAQVKEMGRLASAIIVMTQASKGLLEKYYAIDPEKIDVIAHGTHLVKKLDQEQLKEKYGLSGKKVLATFGLLGPGKSIETTLDALPEILQNDPEVMFLIMGKTHPSLVKTEGESYRDFLAAKIQDLGLQDNVRFINKFLCLPELLEYLQLSDIYLFTSKDPNQAVSGTFAYALSCGCPVISTPIPHALEALRDDTGIIVDFTNPPQLAAAVIKLLKDDVLRKNMGLNGLHKSTSSAWENATIAHALLFEKIGGSTIKLHYELPKLNLDHIKRMTTDFGILQFSVINRPDESSGYTLDDNARALITMCRYYEITRDKAALPYIEIYFNFIRACYIQEGYFLNYLDIDKKFTDQNEEVNLEDSNGRAIWALGYLIHCSSLLPKEWREMVGSAETILQSSLDQVLQMQSPRAVAFIVKGLFYKNLHNPSIHTVEIIKTLAGRLISMYETEKEADWLWFESYLTYANSVLPEALLCAWMATGDIRFRTVARTTFNFLLSTIFNKKRIRVVSNKNWLKKGEEIRDTLPGGEQPIDVAYTILALDKFHKVLPNAGYGAQKKSAFNWFLGDNHLNQIIYNPCTGGCYDGLEENNVNLNQGAESTLSYLLARLTFEKPGMSENENLPLTHRDKG